MLGANNRLAGALLDDFRLAERERLSGNVIRASRIFQHLAQRLAFKIAAKDLVMRLQASSHTCRAMAIMGDPEKADRAEELLQAAQKGFETWKDQDNVVRVTGLLKLVEAVRLADEGDHEEAAEAFGEAARICESLVEQIRHEALQFRILASRCVLEGAIEQSKDFIVESNFEGARASENEMKRAHEKLARLLEVEAQRGYVGARLRFGLSILPHAQGDFALGRYRLAEAREHFSSALVHLDSAMQMLEPHVEAMSSAKSCFMLYKGLAASCQAGIAQSDMSDRILDGEPSEIFARLNALIALHDRASTSYCQAGYIGIEGQLSHAAARDQVRALLEELERRRPPFLVPKDARENLLIEHLPLHPTIREAATARFRASQFRDAVLAATIALQDAVKEKSGVRNMDGTALMQHVFSRNTPILAFTECRTPDEQNEQFGWMQLYAGAIQAVRNPRGHSLAQDVPERAAECIAFVSYLVFSLERTVLRTGEAPGRTSGSSALPPVAPPASP